MNTKKSLYEISKRLLDIITASTGLLFFSPIFFFMTIAVLLSVGPPVFYKTKRAGRHGKPFYLIKFRSMKNTWDSSGKLLPDEDRITRVGRIIRRTSLDEIPQLINVLRGEMSIIGPRPLPLSYLSHFDEKQVQRLEVKAGMSGWCQVNYRKGNTKTWDEKLSEDLYYVKHRSFSLDLKIVMMTGAAVLRRTLGNPGGLSTSKEFRK